MSSENTKKFLIIGGAVAVVGGLGFLLWKNKQSSAAAAASEDESAAAPAEQKPATTATTEPSTAAPQQPELTDEDVQKILAMAKQFKDAGNQAVSRGELEPALEMYQRGLSLLRNLPPGHAEGTPLLQVICSNTVLVFNKQERWQDAAFLASCVLEDQEHPVRSEDLKGKLLYRRATAAAKMGNNDAAITDLTAAATFCTGKLKDEILEEKARLESA